MKVEASDLPLERVYRWEKEFPNELYMTQPLGNGQIREYTWAQTVEEASKIANYLKSLNFEPGSHIAILSKNCAEFIMTDLAIWMAGHASVAIYPTLNADTVNYILTHSESKLLFVGKLDTWDEMKPGVPDDLLCLSYNNAPPNDYKKWDDIVASTPAMEDRPVRDEKDIAILVYTSGSTGQPKGVVHDFHNLAVTLKGLSEILKFDSNDRQLSYLPLAHVFERAAVEIGSIYNRTKVYFAESLTTFAADLQRARPTLFHSVPRLWLKFQLGVFAKMPEKKLERLAKIPILGGVVKKKVLAGLGLDQCRMAVSGSAPIPPSLIAWYRMLGLELLEGYGMSENFVYSHFSRPGLSRVGYVGSADPDVICKISDEGEILVKSPANMIGYYKQEEATKESFTEDGFLKTGDRGEIDDKGRLKITGRTKELFKTSKGKYIAPAPIENIIGSDNSVESCCVTGSGFPQPHALIMLSEELRGKVNDPGVKESITEAMTALIKTVNSEVEHHEQLQFVVIVKDEWQIENGYLTPTLKIKRNIVEDVYGKKAEEWYGQKTKVIWE